MSDLTHIDEHGNARMVDVSGKEVTERIATAEATVRLSEPAFAALAAGTLKKGDALGVARVAGIMAAKRTSDLIPLCHPLPIAGATVAFELDEREHTVRIEASVKVASRTGVEMEALTAASVAALTIYDMCKAVDKGIVIDGVRLLRKHGGASGEYVRNDDSATI
jgi:cyclic pyranopterin phosphate synthase